MLAFRLLRHSILQVVGNLQPALILSAAPALAVVAAILLWMSAFAEMRGSEMSSVAVIVATLILMIVMILSFVSLAASWHRFVLLGERPRILRPIRQPEWRYLGASIRLALIMMLIAIPIVAVGVAFMTAFAGNLGALLIINLIFGFAIAIVGLRLGTGLAGVATGAERPLTTGWRATGHVLGTLMMLSLFSQLLQLLLNQAIALPGLAGVVATVIVMWSTTLLSLSLITTLWGHFVEGRALR